jgi:hypothetical protein
MDRMSHHGHNCTLLDTHLSVESASITAKVSFIPSHSQVLAMVILCANCNPLVSHIMRDSFIGGGHPSTKIKQPSCCKSLAKFIT